MPIPPFEDMIVPVIIELSDGTEHDLPSLKDSLANRLGVTAVDRDSRLPGKPEVRRFDNRVLWAIQHLKIAGLVERPRRAVYKLTPEGSKLAHNPPKRIDRAYLVAHYPPAREYFAAISAGGVPPSKPGTRGTPPQAAPVVGTPLERIELAVKELDAKLRDDLENKLADCDPTVFETIITRLLVKMGYARSEDDILQLRGGTGDGGIDGRVQRDPLGLEQVYVQAKRWSSSVPLRPVVDFHNEVTRSGVRKGVFVARSGFSNDAQSWIDDARYPERRASVAWIDGKRLAELMIQHGVGVRETDSFVLKGIDDSAFVFESE